MKLKKTYLISNFSKLRDVKKRLSSLRKIFPQGQGNSADKLGAEMRFIVEVNDFLKIIKCRGHNTAERQITFRTDDLAPGRDITEIIIENLRALNYQGEQVIFALPRAKVTLRYLRVPTIDPLEMEKMLTLQAARHIPYAANELLIAYDTVNIVNPGHSYVNLVIARQEDIKVYVQVINALKIVRPMILLGSHGLCWLLQLLTPAENDPILILDIDCYHAELAISRKGTLLFSRALKFCNYADGWQAELVDEISKTIEVYKREVNAKDFTLSSLC